MLRLFCACRQFEFPSEQANKLCMKTKRKIHCTEHSFVNIAKQTNYAVCCAAVFNAFADNNKLNSARSTNKKQCWRKSRLASRVALYAAFIGRSCSRVDGPEMRVTPRRARPEFNTISLSSDECSQALLLDCVRSELCCVALAFPTELCMLSF